MVFLFLLLKLFVAVIRAEYVTRVMKIHLLFDFNLIYWFLEGGNIYTYNIS